jgi:hypothetical protein
VVWVVKVATIPLVEVEVEAVADVLVRVSVCVVLGIVAEVTVAVVEVLLPGGSAIVVWVKQADTRVYASHKS